MAGAVLNEREGAEAVRGARRVGWGRAVFGSACLWAWGFLAYLSPVLIPAERPVGGVGIEVGFFVSQGAVVVAAVAIVLALRKHSVAVGRGVLLVCASLLALASALLPLTVAIDAPWPLVGCGAICGVAGTLLGCAWGARYSLESRDVSAVVMVSFLVAYGIYFAVLLLYVATPFVVAAQVVVVFLPLASWGLWFWDASARSGLAPEVFPSSALSTDIAGSPGSSGKAPGEVTAGSRELHALPWRSLGVIAVAALVGNVMASVIMGTSYEGADSLYPGGIALCACIATMALVPLTAERTAFSVAQLYRITVTFSVVGLVAILVLGAAAVPVGGAARSGLHAVLPTARLCGGDAQHPSSGLVPLGGLRCGPSADQRRGARGEPRRQAAVSSGGRDALATVCRMRRRCARAVLHGGGPSRAGRRGRG